MNKTVFYKGMINKELICHLKIDNVTFNVLKYQEEKTYRYNYTL